MNRLQEIHAIKDIEEKITDKEYNSLTCTAAPLYMTKFF